MGCHTWYYTKLKKSKNKINPITKVVDIILLNQRNNILLKIVNKILNAKSNLIKEEIEKIRNNFDIEIEQCINIKKYFIKLSKEYNLKINENDDYFALKYYLNLKEDFLDCCNESNIDKNYIRRILAGNEYCPEENNKINKDPYSFIDYAKYHNKWYKEYTYTDFPRIYGYPEITIKSKKAFIRYYNQCYQRHLNKNLMKEGLGIVFEPLNKEKINTINKFFKECPNGIVRFG